MIKKGGINGSRSTIIAGDKYGPCKTDCKHKDCAEARKMARSICPKCQKAIGYEIRFYKIEDAYIHADCVEE